MISTVRSCVRCTCQKNIRSYYNNVWENSKNREAKMLNRMVAKLERKKKLNVKSEALSKVGFLSLDKIGSTKGKALNKVYMEHVTELIHSGKHSSEILNQGLEIISVKLTKGGDYLNIYWTCNNEKVTEEALCKMLELSAKELQEQMGSIRYVAKTPFVKFVRDVRIERTQTVETILKTVDFLGEDNKPTQPDSVVTTTNYNFSGDGLPEMRQDLFGIDHAKIKAKILQAMEIYKVTHTPKENEFAYVEMENVVPFDKKTFFKFYKRKRILDRKLTARGLFGWRKFEKYEEEKEDDEDSDLAEEFLKEITKEKEEEMQEYEKNHQS